MNERVAIRGLTKQFGPLLAVDNLSLSVGKGEVLGFLGPNGAGKSTTMRMVTGFLPPTSGTIEVCGIDIQAQPIEARKRIGYMPEGSPLYGDITPAAFLAFIAGIRGLSGADREAKIASAVDKLQIADVLHQPIETLSKGYRRRVGLSQAILHDPDVLILDEPTDGLDPNQKHQVRSLIQSMGRDKAIIISTHILEEVESVCTRAAIIARGRIVFDGTPEALQARSVHHNAVHIRVPVTFADRTKMVLSGIDTVERVTSGEPGAGGVAFEAVPKSGRSIIEMVSARIHAEGIPVDHMAVSHGQLDEVFRELTRLH